MNGENVRVSFAFLTCNEIECTENMSMYGRRVTRGRKFFFIQLILIKHDDGMPVDVVLIGANRDVAKQDAGRIIAQATRILRGMGLYVACISIDRGSNPTN